jgi:4,5-DOPA dioxygenase extradiol
MYPERDVPVVQISVQPSLGTEHHLAIGGALARLAGRLASGDRESVVAYRELAPGAVRAHPTDEHFLPLLVAWGAAGARATARRLYKGLEGAALSMDAYLFEPAAT